MRQVSARRSRAAARAAHDLAGRWRWPRWVEGQRDLLLFSIVVFCILAVDALSVLAPVRHAVAAAHMRAAPVSASGDVLFVAIDGRSLRAVGPWPWSRRVHAGLLRALLDAGAKKVFLHFDLSGQTTPEADAELAGTLEQSGGAVVLAAFRQDSGAGAADITPILPMQAFRDHAWLGAVNVETGRHGVIRRYPYAAVIGGEPVQYAASLLSGVFGPTGSEFFINFAIEPASVPAVSAVDILNGDASVDLDGKTAVVGVHALEIADWPRVPVHGAMSASMIQILATESLAQGIALKRVSRLPVMAAVAALALAGVRWSRARPRAAIAVLASAAVAVEALAYWLQANHALLVPVPAPILILLAAIGTIAEREIDLRRGLLQLSRLEKSNTERVLERVIADSTDAIIVADESMRVLRISRSARALFDVRDDLGAGAPLDEVVPKEMAEAAREAVEAVDNGAPLPPARRSLSLQKGWDDREVEFTAKPSRLWRLRGHRFTREGSAIVCLTARDVTAERNHHARMNRLARYDALTGALNRTEFVERLSARVGDNAEGCAVIVFNLHRLQTINATMGRVVGDALLISLVKRINEAKLDASPVARLGGDRFAIYVLPPMTADQAQRKAERLARLIGAPFQLAGQSVTIALRAGVARGAPGDDAELLLGKAELALDEARIRQGPGLRSFDQTAFERQERTRRIERAHWSALAEEEMYLTYQPIVRLADGTPAGAEALTRWRHPTLGHIPPSEFIEIAEGSGFIEHLGRWVLETACLDAMEWRDGLSLAVNVSPAQFHRSDVVADVERALAVSGFPAERLYLEITESLFMDSSSDFGATFAGLRALGVSLVLDDFGSGFSSFGHLARLPLDKLKVDRMFVQGLDAVAFNRAVIRSVVSLSTELGLTLVCEGVETEAQARSLEALGCLEAQGYFFGRPEPQQALLERFGPQGGTGGSGQPPRR